VTIKAKALADGKDHDFAMVFDNGRSGITYVCTQGNRDLLDKKLFTIAVSRKYKTGADIWLGLGSYAQSPNLADAIVFNADPWEHDEQVEAVAKKVLISGRPLIRGQRKIGRNDRCFCGSGKKYKKCGLLNTEEHKEFNFKSGRRKSDNKDISQEQSA
jgi:hypothetical protein